MRRPIDMGTEELLVEGLNVGVEFGPHRLTESSRDRSCRWVRKAALAEIHDHGAALVLVGHVRHTYIVRSTAQPGLALAGAIAKRTQVFPRDER